MAKLIPNIFTSYELTEAEQLEATVFSDLQIKYLLTLRAEAAVAKNELVLDPDKIGDYVQQESYQTGKIEILSYLLAAHDASIEALNANPNIVNSNEEN